LNDFEKFGQSCYKNFEVILFDQRVVHTPNHVVGDPQKHATIYFYASNNRVLEEMLKEGK
jgi:hypothetical protein